MEVLEQSHQTIQDNHKGEKVMEYKDYIKNLIQERSKLHPDDPRIQNYWNLLTKMLSENENDTIEFLNECEESELYWLSEIFEDISQNLQSINFVKFLHTLKDKFPNLDLDVDIEYAEKAIKSNNN